MKNIIIVGIILVMILIGISFTIKHFKGEGGCCGTSSSVKVKKKKLKNIVKQKSVIIEGMSCSNCKNRVESRLNELDGVAAKVNLKKKTAVVSMKKIISDDEIKKTVEKCGYKVVKIIQ